MSGAGLLKELIAFGVGKFEAVCFQCRPFRGFSREEASPGNINY